MTLGRLFIKYEPFRFLLLACETGTLCFNLFQNRFRNKNLFSYKKIVFCFSGSGGLYFLKNFYFYLFYLLFSDVPGLVPLENKSKNKIKKLLGVLSLVSCLCLVMSGFGWSDLATTNNLATTLLLSVKNV